MTDGASPPAADGVRPPKPTEGARLTILGCGSSGGVPRATGDWGACDPTEPRNRRRRCALLAESADATVLIDATPDFREQMLAVGPPHRIDAVFFTHTHADQAHGVDDLRAYVIKQRERIPVYALHETAQELRSRFEYCFVDTMGYPAILNLCAQHAPISVGGLIVEAAAVVHGAMPGVAGYRISRGGRAAGYIPDANDLPAKTVERFQGLDVLILDALRPAPHPSHFSLDDALSWIERLAPRRAVLTNMHIDLDYRSLKAELPDGVEPAYDGMEILL